MTFADWLLTIELVPVVAFVPCLILVLFED